MGLMGIKRGRILPRFKTYKLVLVAKYAYNKLIDTGRVPGALTEKRQKNFIGHCVTHYG
jgi:hypothetical protein